MHEQQAAAMWLRKTRHINEQKNSQPSTKWGRSADTKHNSFYVALSGYVQPTSLMLKPALFMRLCSVSPMVLLPTLHSLAMPANTIYKAFWCLQGRILLLEQHTQASTSCSITSTLLLHVHKQTSTTSFPPQSVVWISIDVTVPCLWRRAPTTFHLRKTARLLLHISMLVLTCSHCFFQARLKIRHYRLSQTPSLS